MPAFIFLVACFLFPYSLPINIIINNGTTSTNSTWNIKINNNNYTNHDLGRSFKLPNTTKMPASRANFFIAMYEYKPIGYFNSTSHKSVLYCRDELYHHYTCRGPVYKHVLYSDGKLSYSISNIK